MIPAATSVVLVVVDGERAVAVQEPAGDRVAPRYSDAARELVARANDHPEARVAWIDRRFPAADLGSWAARLRHRLEVRHLGSGETDDPARASFGYVDFDSPYLVPPPAGYPVASPLISPLAGIADAVVVRTLLDPALGFTAALLELGLRGLRHGVVPIAEASLVDASLVDAGVPPLPPLPWRDAAILVRRVWGRRWLLFWAAAGVLDRRPHPVALLAGLAATAAPPVDPELLDAARPTPQRSAEPARVAAIIPTLGRPGLVEDVFRDLAAQSIPIDRAVVVEQDPDRDEADAWSHEPPRPGRAFPVARLLTARAGACRARNLALSRTGEVDWVLFLDDDVRLPTDAVERLLAIAHGWGARTVQALPHQPHEDPATLCPAPYPVLWATFGAGAALVAQSAVDAVGGFDERLDGGYGEDYEYGVRLRAVGAEVLLAPEVAVLHLKAPAGGFRTHHVHPWHGDRGAPPRPSPTVRLSRLLHHPDEMRRGYALQYALRRLRAVPPWRWPREVPRWRREWRSSLWWARRLEASGP